MTKPTRDQRCHSVYSIVQCMPSMRQLRLTKPSVERFDEKKKIILLVDERGGIRIGNFASFRSPQSEKETAESNSFDVQKLLICVTLTTDGYFCKFRSPRC